MKKRWWNIGKAAFAVLMFAHLQIVISNVVVNVIEFVDPFATAQQMLTVVQSLINEISVVSGVMTLAVLWLVWRVQGRRLGRQIGLRRIQPTHVLLSLLLGAGVCLIATIAVGLIPWPETWIDTYTESSEPIAQTWNVLSFIATVVVAPVTEEVVFRGVAYTSLKNAMPRWLAALLVSAAFGAMHGTWIWFSYTFVLSFVMIFAYEKAKSLWAPIVVHMTFNLIGQLPLFGGEVPLVSLVLIAVGGAGLTAASCFLLRATQPEEETV